MTTGWNQNLKTVLSKGDAVSLLEIIQQCVSCAAEDEFRRIISRLHSLISFDYAITVIAEIGTNRLLKSYEALNISYPSEWLAMYIAQSEHKRDPIFRANFNKFKLQYFEDILRESDYPKKSRAVANDFGIVDGYVHGVKNHSGTCGGMICFAGRRIDRDRRMEAMIELVVPHLHQAFGRLAGRNGSVADRCRFLLSPKEKEVLKWLKHGKNTWDLSVLLGISERTVKFHISNIMQKLDASSRTHAVAIAIEQGLINIE